MKKQGILMPETLKLILAVVGIVILFGLAVKLYQVSTAKTDVQQAKFNLDTINRIIENLVKEGGGEEEYILLSPKEWVLTTWPINYVYYYDDGLGSPIMIEYPESYIPNQCKVNNWKRCICLCSEVSGDELLEACNKLSICKEIQINLEKNSPIFISDLIEKKKPLTISLNNENLKFYVK